MNISDTPGCHFVSLFGCMILQLSVNTRAAKTDQNGGIAVKREVNCPKLEIHGGPFQFSGISISSQDKRDISRESLIIMFKCLHFGE